MYVYTLLKYFTFLQINIFINITYIIMNNYYCLVDVILFIVCLPEACNFIYCMFARGILFYLLYVCQRHAILFIVCLPEACYLFIVCLPEACYFISCTYVCQRHAILIIFPCCSRLWFFICFITGRWMLFWQKRKSEKLSKSLTLMVRGYSLF